MYEIRCVVGDKKLREVLVFLINNNTLEPPVVIPVLDENDLKVSPPVTQVEQRALPSPASKKRKTSGGRHLKGMGATAVIRSLIETTGATAIFAREMREALMGAGYSKNAYTHPVKLLLADKTIRRVGRKSNGEFKVMRTGTSNGASRHG